MPSWASPRPTSTCQLTLASFSTDEYSQVNRDKHVLRGKLLALQGKGAAAADEVAFLGNDSARRLERAGDNVAATRPAGTSRPTVDGIVKKDL